MRGAERIGTLRIAKNVQDAKGTSGNLFTVEKMDKEIAEKAGEEKEIIKILYSDGDISELDAKANYKRIKALEESQLKADRKYDAKREHG